MDPLAPPEPESLEQTGLPESLVEHLILKILYFRGELYGQDLSDRHWPALQRHPGPGGIAQTAPSRANQKIPRRGQRGISVRAHRSRPRPRPGAPRIQPVFRTRARPAPSVRQHGAPATPARGLAYQRSLGQSFQGHGPDREHPAPDRARHQRRQLSPAPRQARRRQNLPHRISRQPRHRPHLPALCHRVPGQHCPALRSHLPPARGCRPGALRLNRLHRALL